MATSNKVEKRINLIITICLVLIFIVFSLMISLSIQAVFDDIKVITHKNAVVCTVDKFEYSDRVCEYSYDSEDGTNLEYITFYNLDCDITFKNEVDGYRDYNYNYNKITTKEIPELTVNRKYLVLFNDINYPIFIEKSDFIVCNAALLVNMIILFLIICLIIFKVNKSNKVNLSKQR
jgi:hypothetical protein